MRFALLPAVLLASLGLLACGQDTEVVDEASDPQPRAQDEQPRIAGSVPVDNGTPSSVAINPAGGTVYVAYTDIDILSVFDSHSLELTATIDLPAGGFHGVGVNPATGKVYVANSTDGTVSVIDGGTNEVIKELRVPNGMVNRATTSVVANPETNKVYVSRLDDSNLASSRYGITIIDGGRDWVIGKIDLDGPGHAMAFDPTTNDLYAVVESWAQSGAICPESYLVVRIDAETDSLGDCMNFGGWNTLGVAISADGATLYNFNDTYNVDLAGSVTTLTIAELATRRWLATVDYAEFTPKSIAVDPGFGRMYILADDSGECCNPGDIAQLLAMDGKDIVWTLPLGKRPVAFAFDAGSGDFYVVTADRTLDLITQ